MKIQFLKLQNNKYPVEKFLHKIADKDNKAFERIKLILEQFDEDFLNLINAGFFKKMKGYEKYRLWEFKIRYASKEHRILSCLYGDTCYLIHGFIKKTQKTEQKHINTAIQRIKNYIL